MAKKGQSIEIDKSVFEGLCAIQCTREEVSAVLNCDEKTLDKWIKRTYGNNETYSTIYEKNSFRGKASLRRVQWQLAQKSVPMAIFLGKQWLDQKDDYRKPNINIEQADEPVRIVFDL